MKDVDEFDYEVYFGSASIFSLRFVLGLLSEFVGKRHSKTYELLQLINFLVYLATV